MINIKFIKQCNAFGLTTEVYSVNDKIVTYLDGVLFEDDLTTEEIKDVNDYRNAIKPNR